MSLRSLLPVLTLAVSLLLTVLLSLSLFGCAGTKAVDSTAAVQAITAGESRVTYTLMPGLESLDPALKDRVIAIPTVPGKDVDFKMYNDAGQLKVSLTTARSPVIDTLLAAVAGLDAEKFAEDARLRAWITAERQAWMETILPLVQQQIAWKHEQAQQPKEESTPPAWAQELLDILKQKLQGGPTP